MITAENITRHELIGLCITIEKSSNRTEIGISGKIIDETKNTILIHSDDNSIKRIQKQGRTFKITLPDKSHAILDGNTIASNPIRRVKN